MFGKDKDDSTGTTAKPKQISEQIMLIDKGVAEYTYLIGELHRLLEPMLHPLPPSNIGEVKSEPRVPMAETLYLISQRLMDANRGLAVVLANLEL